MRDCVCSNARGVVVACLGRAMAQKWASIIRTVHTSTGTQVGTLCVRVFEQASGWGQLVGRHLAWRQCTCRGFAINYWLV